MDPSSKEVARSLDGGHYLLISLNMKGGQIKRSRNQSKQKTREISTPCFEDVEWKRKEVPDDQLRIKERANLCLPHVSSRLLGIKQRGGRAAW